MEFRCRAGIDARALGVLAGSFHPPTLAHLALARAGLAEVNEVAFVLPRAFPHKQYDRVGLEDRLRLVEAATAGEPRFSVAVSEGGLFSEIARECRAACGAGARVGLWFLCGRDAAERIVNWDYGRAGAIEEMLEEFGLLVAPRQGAYTPPPHLAARVRPLVLEAEYDELSATEVRRRILSGAPWEHLVPSSIRRQVGDLYRRA